MCNPEKVDKILLTSGKHYYTLLEKRESLGAMNTAIIRLECFCPFPTLELRTELANYKHVKGNIKILDILKIYDPIITLQLFCGVKKNLKIWALGHLLNQDLNI